MSSAKARPSSAQSRTAWGDYGNARPDNQFDFGQDGIRDDADLSPTAMEDDSVYMSADKNKGKTGPVATTSSNKQSKSCFGKVGGAIRCKPFIRLYTLFFSQKFKAYIIDYHQYFMAIIDLQRYLFT